MQNSPPESPMDKPQGSALQRKRTLSGSRKVKHDPTSSTNSSRDLPPPPSRARKIIQMKPKESVPPEPQNPPTPTSSAKSPSQPTTSTKRRQPSATSAAGRKIARKTAHSIIERRRRSKMNEEFGVLKDMIPACEGVDMHKLAILQAGIDYVRYLEGCVKKLQGQQVQTVVSRDTSMLNESEDREMEEPPPAKRPASVSEEGRRSTNIQGYRRSSTASTATNSTLPSPNMRPTTSSSSTTSHPHCQPSSYNLSHSAQSTSPPPVMTKLPLPTGVSPAFQAIHFSPDMSRSSAYSFSNSTSVSSRPSPLIMPLPQAALPLAGGQGEGAAEATATAALMMLTSDRRGTGRGGGMSVRDLLSN